MNGKGKAEFKYFSETIGYPAMRRALRARGWIQVKGYRRMQQLTGQISGATSGGIGFDSTIIRQFDN